VSTSCITPSPTHPHTHLIAHGHKLVRTKAPPFQLLLPGVDTLLERGCPGRESHGHCPASLKKHQHGQHQAACCKPPLLPLPLLLRRHGLAWL